MIAENIQWVRGLAHKLYRNCPSAKFEVEDLVQEGLIGLMRAAQIYDPQRNDSFQGFAVLRVQGAMIDFMRKQSWPRGVRKLRRRISEVRERFSADHGRDPDTGELAAGLGCSVQALRRNLAVIATMEVVSTGQTDRPDCVAGLVSDMFVLSKAPDYESALDADRAAHRLRRELDRLNARDRRVLDLYYREELKMRQIGDELGLHESRVSQIHKEALGKLAERLAA